MKRSVKISLLVFAVVLAFGLYFGKSAKMPADGSGGLREISKQADLGYLSPNSYQEVKSQPSEAEVSRKIIQSGHLSLYVKHYDPFYQALQKQLAVEGGFISNIEANRSAGKLISARLVIRVPSSRTNIFVSWLHENGRNYFRKNYSRRCL